MESQPQILNSGLILKTFTHAYAHKPLLNTHADISSCTATTLYY